MKQGKREKETSSKENGMNKDDIFFLPRQNNKEEPDQERRNVEGTEQKKENLSDLFFLSDFPWRDD